MSDGPAHATPPASSPTNLTPTPADPQQSAEDEVRGRIAALEREARALGPAPEAALLFHEMGLLWENRLRHARNAAVAYQAAFRLAPRFLANIRAARRLFGEVGNWAMVVQLIDAELAATDGARVRAALHFEKAQILAQRLSKEQEASAAAAECLATEPQDVTLLVQLEQLYQDKQEHAQLVRVYRLLAKAVSNDMVKAHYLTSAGMLLEDRLKDSAGAAALYREAFAVDRKDPLLLSAIKRVAQREGTTDEELAALAAEAEGLGAQAAPVFLQIGKTYERLGRPEDALAALQAARRVAPGDPLILAELARSYETRGRHEELADILKTWADLAHDEADFVSLQLRLASLVEEQLKRDEDAIGCYRAVLARVPGNAAALAGLGKIYHRQQNWQGLYETCEAEAAACEDPKLRAARLYKAGETLEERLGRSDDAIARYSQCLTLSPGFLPAQKALIRLFEKYGLWAELVSMYEQDLNLTPDREQQIGTLNKIAALYEDRLANLPRAIDALKRVLDLAPDHLPTMGNLGRLYERSGAWAELLALNEQEARLSNDTKQIISLAHRNAEILEEQLDDRPAAIVAWERVHQLSPTYMPALRALGRLYGQDGRWDALVKMYRGEAEISPSTDQAANLIFKVGEIFEQRLKDDNQAISAYQEVLTLAPSHFPALRALARMHRAVKDWESLIEILYSEAANRTDPNERANAIFQAAAIWEDRLKKPEKAVAALQEVLRLAPNHVSALQQLEQLMTARDDVKELIVLLDRQTQVGPPHARVAAQLRLARLYLERLSEAARAATCCEAALAEEPDNLAALRLLERIRANDRPRRAELRARIAEVSGDAALAVAIRLSAIEPPNPVPPGLLAEVKAASALDPGNETLAQGLERVLEQLGDARSLVALLDGRRSLATDPIDQQQLTLRIAELYERLGEPQRALEELERLLNATPGLYPAMLGLVRCYSAVGDLGRARATLEAISRAVHDVATAQRALMDAARLAATAQRDEEAAIGLLRRVLEREPLHPEAGPQLEEILARRGGAADLAALHEKRADAKRAGQDLFNAGHDYYQAARVYLEQAKEPARALALLDKALAAQPTHPGALELKAQLCAEAEAWPEAAAALATRIQQGGDARHLSAMHLRLGGLWQDHLGDPTRAASHLQTALTSNPGSVEALERLATLHSQSKNWTGAADCLRRLLELEHSPSARARHTVSLAQLTDEGFGDAAQAAALYKQALELAPGDVAVIDRLVSLFERGGNLAELATTLDKQAQQAGEPRRAAALKIRVGSLYAGRLDDKDRAVAAYRQAIELEPTNLAAHVALADLFALDTATLAMSIETHRAILRLDPTRADSLHALFQTWEALHHTDRAFCAAAALAFLRAATDVEQAFYSEARNRLPAEIKGALTPNDLVTLHHPGARNGLVELIRAVGDQFTKLLPASFEALGLDRKADRLKPDSALYKAIQPVVAAIGVEEFELYQGKRGLVLPETTEPLSLVVGPDVVRRFNVREQRFLYGQGALQLADKTAILRKASPPELTDIVGNSVRIFHPAWTLIGRRNDDQSKQLRKAYSRRALKVLEEVAGNLVRLPSPPSLEGTVLGLAFTADRAGQVMCADPAAGLGVLLREEAAPGTPRPEAPEAIAATVRTRPELGELICFTVSDDFFRLRQVVGTALG